jgi:MarR family transcriptional regulator, temperature-dependent positive regulator of motility
MPAPVRETICPEPDAAAPAPTRVLPRHRVPAHLARRFHQICLGMSAAILDPVDLNPIEYALLAAVDDNPGTDQRGLRGRLGVDPASTSQMVERLARRGLLEQAVQPTDRRARLLSLTPVGAQLRARLRPDLLAAQDRVLSVLSAEDQETLIVLLARVVEGNDAYARPGNGRRKPKRGAEATATRAGSKRSEPS